MAKVLQPMAKTILKFTFLKKVFFNATSLWSILF
jgi:hypothetical protein